MGDHHCYIYAFATFGHPNDFRQTPFLYRSESVAKKIKVFDLSNAVKVFPNSKIYAVRKQSEENSNLISYAVYTYAQEQTSKRDGTFIGSSIILENTLSDETHILSCLEEFHQSLIQNNLENGVLKVNHSRDFVPVNSLKDLDKIKNHKREIKKLTYSQSNKSLVVFCETSVNKLSVYLKLSIDLLNVYDAIYFTQSKDVAEYVRQKGIYPLIQNVNNKKELEIEIQKLEEVRKRQRQSSILECEQEFQKLEENKNKVLNDIREQIKHSKNTHRENEEKIRESEKELQNLQQVYVNFSYTLKTIISQLKSGKDFDEVAETYTKNKNGFRLGVSELSKTGHLHHISKANVKSAFQPEHQHPDYAQNHFSDSSQKEKLTKRADVYKVAILLLTALLIGTWVYFLFFYIVEEPNKVFVKPNISFTLLDGLQKKLMG